MEPRASPSTSAASSGSPTTTATASANSPLTAPSSPSGYSDNKASINHPQGIAIDGSGHVWVTNYSGSSITELAGSATASPGQILSPTAGYAHDASHRRGLRHRRRCQRQSLDHQFLQQHPYRNRRPRNPRQNSAVRPDPDPVIQLRPILTSPNFHFRDLEVEPLSITPDSLCPPLSGLPTFRSALSSPCSRSRYTI